MVVDIKYFRDPKLLEILRASEKRRCVGPAAVDRVIELDAEWRKCQYSFEQAKSKLNRVSKEIGLHFKNNKGDVADSLAALKLDAEVAKKDVVKLEEALNRLVHSRERSLRHVGNLVPGDVLASNDEAENVVVSSWAPQLLAAEDSGAVDDAANGDSAEFAFEQTSLGQYIEQHGGCSVALNPQGIATPSWPLLSHADLIEKIGGVDLELGTKVAGHRGYYLKGLACMLNMALINYGTNFLVKRGYIPVMPPYFMRRDMMKRCAELDDFEETLYGIPDDTAPVAAPCNAAASKSAAKSVNGNCREAATVQDAINDQDNRLFLIATSEQPIAALHYNETYSAKSLPLCYAGISSCFRREAGAHGKDVRGIFRVHQFQKVEQFCVTTAQESEAMHQKMLRVSEDFYRSLGIPYRIVCIVAGALNKAAAKKYDLEAWFPQYNDYRELVSCSNCTDFQARDLNARYFTNDTAQKTFTHMLNGTLVATQRCLCCILENFQTPNGIVVPEPLVPYMDGVDFIPFVK